jgi:hypothetical protein
MLLVVPVAVVDILALKLLETDVAIAAAVDMLQAIVAIVVAKGRICVRDVKVMQAYKLIAADVEALVMYLYITNRI